jgi:hypothetical protein
MGKFLYFKYHKKQLSKHQVSDLNLVPVSLLHLLIKLCYFLIKLINSYRRNSFHSAALPIRGDQQELISVFSLISPGTGWGTYFPSSALLLRLMTMLLAGWAGAMAHPAPQHGQGVAGIGCVAAAGASSSPARLGASSHYHLHSSGGLILQEGYFLCSIGWLGPTISGADPHSICHLYPDPCFATVRLLLFRLN